MGTIYIGPSFSDSSNVNKKALVDADRHPQIDVLSSALPVGAATSEKQDTGNTSLANIETSVASKATKIVISWTNIYVGKAAIGSATSSAVWSVKRIETATDIIIKWADGNDSYDNVFDNYSALTYT